MVLAGWGHFPVWEGELCAPAQRKALDYALKSPYAPRGLGRSYRGRVYLSKDAWLRPDIFKAMVPGWSDFMQRVKSVNPQGHCPTAMSERLQLWADA